MLKAKTCPDRPLCLTCQGVLEDQVIPERQPVVPEVELGPAHIQDTTMQGPGPTSHCGDGPVLPGAWALRASGDSRMAFGRCYQPGSLASWDPASDRSYKVSELPGHLGGVPSPAGLGLGLSLECRLWTEGLPP